MQTSVITISPGTRSLISRIARCTSPSSFHASLPNASLRSGIPNRMTAGTPAAQVSRASATTLSTDICATPGIDATAFFTPRPAHTNIGRIRSSAESRVSRTMRRIVSVRRRRRGRLIGKGMMVLAGDYIGRGNLTPNRLDVCLVVRAHRAERAHLMIREFVVRVAMLGAEHASRARVASRGAVRLHFHAMRQTFRDVPSRLDTHSVDRAGWDTATRDASGAWVEA